MTDKTRTQIVADSMAIKYHHNANDATIQKQIDSHLENNPVSTALPESDYVPLTEAEFQAKYRKVGDRRKKCGQLIRCRIQNMHPEKKDWPGEIISVGSAKLGTWKKFVPFDAPDAYHLPQIIFDALKEKKCTIFTSKKDSRGNDIRKGRLVNEYALEVLPRLSPDELSDLAKQQALQAGQQ